MALKDATPEQRAQFLKQMEVFGSEAHQAALDLLRKIDQGEPVKMPSPPPEAHVAKVEALNFPPIGKIVQCLAKCASHIPNWPAFGLCLLSCITGS